MPTMHRETDQDLVAEAKRLDILPAGGYPELDLDFIEGDWIVALRSGDYRQGQHRLRTINDTFCCLGVACDRLHRAGRLPDWETVNGRWEIGGQATVLPSAATTTLGLPSGVQGHTGPKIRLDWTMSMVHANDSRGATFPQIADALQQVVDAERARRRLEAAG